jgi:hypothetical protein
LIKYQIMSYVFNFTVQILLIMIYDLCLVDRTMYNSPFYVIWVVGLEVQVMTSVSRLPVHFRGQFWTPLHNQNVQERKGIISFNCILNLMVGLSLLRCCRNCCNLAGPCGHAMEVSMCQPFSRFVVCCIQCYFLKGRRKETTRKT